MKKLTRQSHWQYTTINELKKFIPRGFSSGSLVVKELLDNACDEVDKNAGDDWVKIKFSGGVLEITNSGVLLPEDLKIVTDFSLKISEKYFMKAFVRGQIGHGLKIALMLAINEENDIEIKSASHLHLIKLIDRFSENPKEVLGIKSSATGENPHSTTIKMKVASESEDINTIDQYILRYIALNPQISFEYNHKKYPQAVKLKKNNKVDVFSYFISQFEEFAENYFTGKFTHEEFISLFNVKRGKIKEICHEFSSSSSHIRLYQLFWLIKENSRKIPHCSLGKEGISKRIYDVFNISVKKYKKVNIDHGFAEIAVLEEMDDDSFNCIGMNGSCFYSDSIKIDMDYRYRTIMDVKEKMDIKDPLYFSFYSTSPEYSGTNKDSVSVGGKGAYRALKNMFKNEEPKNKTSTWLIKEDEYKQSIRNIFTLGREAYLQGFTLHIYKFIMECKSIAVDMHSSYGQITLRQLYYQLVSKLIIENNAKSYNNFIGHMVSAREKEIIDHDLFEDRSRYTIIPYSISSKRDVRSYIKNALDASLHLPKFDLWEEQEYYVEIWIEKDALAGLFQKVTSKKQVALFPSRGYTSVTKIEEARKRFAEKRKEGKKCVLLYAGDLDPSGWDIYMNIRRKFKKEDHIELKRFFLNRNQTEGLIPMPNKTSDSRHKSFISDNPGLRGIYELDAVPPDKLMRMTENAIDQYFDPGLVPKERVENWEKKFNFLKNEIQKKLDFESWS